MPTNTIGYCICEADGTSIKPTVVTTEKNRVICEGCLQDVNVKNRNGRYYADNELFPELKSSRTIELTETGNLFGEAGHPIDPNIARQQTIDPKLIAPKYLKIWTEGNKVMARFKGAQTPYGQSFNDIILDETRVSFSLRALGSVENTQKGAEVKNLKIITWDWVIYPSHKSAYMDKIISESSILTESTMYHPEDGYIYGSNDLPNKIIMNESSDSIIMSPITDDTIVQMIKQESSNYYLMKESFNIYGTSVKLINEGRQVQLSDTYGHMYVINLEDHVQDLVMDYCSKI